MSAKKKAAERSSRRKEVSTSTPTRFISRRRHPVILWKKKHRKRRRREDLNQSILEKFWKMRRLSRSQRSKEVSGLGALHHLCYGGCPEIKQKLGRWTIVEKETMLATLNLVSDFDMEISNLVIILLERVAINMNNSVSSKSQYFAQRLHRTQIIWVCSDIWFFSDLDNRLLVDNLSNLPKVLIWIR